MGDPFGRALAEEATKKSGMVWLSVVGGRPRAAWHVWHADALCLVTGGLEQELPDLYDGARVRVTVPSKDKGGRLVTWTAAAHLLRPDTEAWRDTTTALHAQRLNPPDGEEQPTRWARESQVWRLEPTNELVEKPGAMPEGSHAAPPPPSPATTRGPLPFMLGRRR